MSSNVFNSSAYIRTSREFPEELHQLTVEVNKAYVDTAQAVNSRVISSFATTKPVITGEKWYITNNQAQEAFRQVYTFTSTANIPHKITLTQIDRFVGCYGTYTDGTNWYGIPFGSNVAVVGMLSFYVTATNIVFVVGAGSPAVVSGTIVLQWLSQP